MMFGEHDYPPNSYAPLPINMVAYDTKNRALVPTADLQEWLKHNARGPWVVTTLKMETGGLSNAIIRFVDERDTVLFKMWWQ